MVVRSETSINQEIVKMRKKNAGLNTIFKWCDKWDNFQQLDEQVVLAHILEVLDKEGLAVSRNEVRNCFNRHYNKEYHGDKKGYLNWLYKEFNIKVGTKVRTNQIRRGVLVQKQLSSNTMKGNLRRVTKENRLSSDMCVTTKAKPISCNKAPSNDFPQFCFTDKVLREVEA